MELTLIGKIAEKEVKKAFENDGIIDKKEAKKINDKSKGYDVFQADISKSSFSIFNKSFPSPSYVIDRAPIGKLGKEDTLILSSIGGDTVNLYAISDNRLRGVKSSEIKLKKQLSPMEVLKAELDGKGSEELDNLVATNKIKPYRVTRLAGYVAQVRGLIDDSKDYRELERGWKSIESRIKPKSFGYDRKVMAKIYKKLRTDYHKKLSELSESSEIKPDTKKDNLSPMEVLKNELNPNMQDRLDELVDNGRIKEYRVKVLANYVSRARKIIDQISENPSNKYSLIGEWSRLQPRLMATIFRMGPEKEIMVPIYDKLNSEYHQALKESRGE